MDPLSHRYTDPFSSLLLPNPEQTHQLHDLLRSNSLPREASHFQSVIASAAADLVDYDTAIERFQQMLRTMASERAALQDYSDRCRSVFAPVRRLPTEILGEIFSLCALEPMQLFVFWEHKTPRNNIDRVAQTHLLRSWATIDVDLSETQPRDITKITKLLSLSLRRSANYPLTIHVHAGRSIDPSRAVLELLAEHSSRWQTADIYISEFAFAYISAAKGNLPLLERLNISGASLSLLDIFEDAPNLTRVSFSELGSDLPKLPWSQLHGVTYSHVWSVDNLRDGLQIMGRCPSGCRFSIFDLDIADLLSLFPASCPFTPMFLISSWRWRMPAVPLTPARLLGKSWQHLPSQICSG
ncbi:hypothetical protein FB451DRAFT_1055675 [Mycena latifolia]|nr:hypothetical protein FB451DRAFT_1055675 [Mycena latifolia]